MARKPVCTFLAKQYLQVLLIWLYLYLSLISKFTSAVVLEISSKIFLCVAHSIEILEIGIFAYLEKTDGNKDNAAFI